MCVYNQNGLKENKASMDKFERMKNGTVLHGHLSTPIKQFEKQSKDKGNLECIWPIKLYINNTKKIYKCKTLNEYTVEKNTSKGKVIIIAHFVQVPKFTQFVNLITMVILDKYKMIFHP